MLIENSSLLLFFMTAFGSGALASVMGLGGGVILVPVFTLLLGVPFSTAAATSIVAVVAASNGAAIKFHQNGFTNVNLGIWLELGTVVGAILGVLLVGSVPQGVLFFTFSVVLILATLSMLKDRKDRAQTSKDVLHESLDTRTDFSEKIGINGSDYKVRHPVLGLFLSVFAGLLSSMLGVGGGIVKVPMMNSLMKVPLKISVATSSFMIGITASAGALMYLLQSKLELALVAPTVAGVLLGSYVASHFFSRLPQLLIKRSFAVLAIIVAFRMFMKGLEQL